MSKIETLIIEKNFHASERWGPSMVVPLESALSIGAFRAMPIALRKNIVYSLQYLQYIQLQIDELKLHDVIYTQLVKSYIIIAMSIVEGVFYHLLKSNNLQKKEEWEEIEKVHTNVFKRSDDIKYKTIVTTFKMLSNPIDGRMDFESMIARVRSKNLIKLNNAAYPYIKEIRNKVHLHISKDSNDTDYKKLSYVDYYLARYVLYRILTNEVFYPIAQGGTFEWINPPARIIAEITPILEQRRELKNQQ